MIKNLLKLDIIKLLISIFITEMAGIIGSLFTMKYIPTWYEGINKPSISPPNWVFGPVWTTLFLLMGIALYLIWKKGFNKKGVDIAIYIFSFQLLLNILWSVIFFSLQNPGLAFIELIALWISILFTIISFYKISKPAAYLLIPYILWVSFAGYLNYYIYLIN